MALRRAWYSAICDCAAVWVQCLVLLACEVAWSAAGAHPGGSHFSSATSDAVEICLAGDFVSPTPSVSGAAEGQAFPFLLSRHPSLAIDNGSVAGSSFALILSGLFRMGFDERVASGIAAPFPALFVHSHIPPTASGASTGMRFLLQAVSPYDRIRSALRGEAASLAFAGYLTGDFARRPYGRAGDAASLIFAGYLTGDFVRRYDGRAGEATATALVLRMLAMAEVRMGSAVSPLFPLMFGGDPVAVTVSLVRAEFAEGVAHVSWRLHDHQGEYTVERALTPDEWTELGRFLPDGKGEIAVEDRDVTAGQRYGYRVVGDDAVRSGLGEVWVEVPLFQLGMTGATPNPARLGQLMVSFVLPDREPARLEVLDVAGRIVASHDVGALGPGAHVFDASRGVRFSPGVYFLRLVRAERALVKKATLTR